MSTATKPARRQLNYQSLEDFSDDVERLASQPVVTVGNWSFAQILYHLRVVMIASLDGFPTQLPWIVRRTVGPLMKWYLLKKPMLPAGFKAPKSAQPLMPPVDADLAQELEAMRSALSRFQHETPTPEHPIFGKMSKADWDLLHRRHSALHMSFVVPQSEDCDSD